MVRVQVERLLVTYPILRMRDIFQGQQVMLDKLRNLRQRLELVDIGQMKISMEVWIAVLLVLHTAAQCHTQASETTKMIATRCDTTSLITAWTI